MSVSASSPWRNMLTPLRQVAEAVVSLAIAVVIFRAFGVEGFMISTGSMAPTLLGYHHHLQCPSCHYEFERGAAPPETESSLRAQGQELGALSPGLLLAHCPNCGLSEFSFTPPRATEGDQLLVQKHAFEFRDPRRWEVVVFRNPRDPRQAYVKRAVGLPNERVQIVDGEVHINGQPQFKPYATQVATRLLVSDYTHRPAVVDSQRQPRWSTVNDQSSWVLNETALTFQPGIAAPRTTDWVEYRHWRESGGKHITRVPLSQLPTGLAADELAFGQLQWTNGQLHCAGVLPERELNWWSTRTTDRAFLDALQQLAWSSHIGPVTDECDYNADIPDEHIVEDLSLALELNHAGNTGRFEMQLVRAGKEYRAVVDFAANTVNLLLPDSPVPVASKALPLDWRLTPLSLELSTIDGHMLLAVAHEQVGEPIPLPATPPQGLRRPARIGASGGSCEVTGLKLYRDLYYTPKGEPGEIQLAADEFYVLGDNSPVSLDSRAWDHPAVSRKAFIGKPLVVHLPSKLGIMNWGGASKPVRVPDIARMRVVR